MLQADFKMAGINTGRLVLNTTVGILGIFDVADKMGFPEYVKEDYGQTFGKWGMGPGCYLVASSFRPYDNKRYSWWFCKCYGRRPIL